MAIWRGSKITQCDIDGRPITDEFIDGALRNGRWAIMCPACHVIYGFGLGIGRGQRYVRRDDGVFVKAKEKQ